MLPCCRHETCSLDTDVSVRGGYKRHATETAGMQASALVIARVCYIYIKQQLLLIGGRSLFRFYLTPPGEIRHKETARFRSLQSSR
ncbi:unnamed protein product [Sphagnum jensenii]|uniref:Uncharacterized protein n=1 Tax=Sphagnum jensenii TaxID=128206 RepID=A0ABP1B373_9BRYO